MAKRKRKTSRSRKTSKRPIGYIKKGKKYKLVYGSKSKPRLSKKTFKTKAKLMSYVRKKR